MLSRKIQHKEFELLRPLLVVDRSWQIKHFVGLENQWLVNRLPYEELQSLELLECSNVGALLYVMSRRSSKSPTGNEFWM